MPSPASVTPISASTPRPPSAARARIPISLHCWQADDVRGLETPKDGLTGGGIMATGSHPGRARNGDEMRADLDFALSLLPGKQRLNLHAFYAETGSQVVDRDEIEPQHFARWLGWAKSRRRRPRLQPDLLRPPARQHAATRSPAPTPATRKFWIRHGKACRHIAESFAQDPRLARRAQPLGAGRLPRMPRPTASPRASASPPPTTRSSPTSP